MDLRRDTELPLLFWDSVFGDNTLQEAMDKHGIGIASDVLPPAICMSDTESIYGGSAFHHTLGLVPNDFFLPTCVSPMSLLSDATPSQMADSLGENEEFHQSPAANQGQEYCDELNKKLKYLGRWDQNGQHNRKNSRQPNSPGASHKNRRASRLSSNNNGCSGSSSDSGSNSKKSTAKPGAAHTGHRRLRSSVGKLSPEPSSSKDSEDRHRPPRTSHNAVEKRYRDNLNQQFDQLLAALEKIHAKDGFKLCGGLQVLSKGALLNLAIQTIRALNEDNESLSRQIESESRHATNQA